MADTENDDLVRDLKARIEQLEAEKAQTAHWAPEALAAQARGPRVACMYCQCWHEPGDKEACGLCFVCRRPKGAEFYANTVTPPCDACGSHPVTPDMLAARGHHPAAVAAMRGRR
jgi:hypothetical protein